jgi:hypothetical protein
VLCVSPSNPPESEDIPDGWSDLTEEERADLDAAFTKAEEEMRNGVPGIPLDEALPRYHGSC